MTTEELGWAIGFHEGDRTKVAVMLRGAEKRNRPPKYRELLKRLVEGHGQAIAMLREELRLAEANEDHAAQE